ncbi:MAG: leucyl/phenylalanyl-tRNA--protein transferase [Desulfovibrionaceae bacterium]|jgi:leucyl/phenylalanyl-tRNA--protein transferase|nr:leucyl/phenylalanyl-tRNA--protein transferase [Desulfovibrionaceae bacterium]
MPVYLLPREPLFPAPEEAEADGILAIGGDLSVERLLAAYSMGIFPWYGPEGPILWWSPDPRLVLFPDELHVPRRLARVLRRCDLGRGRFVFSVDRAFGRVIRRCAASPRPQGEGTWLVPEMIEGFCALHAAGYAHSVEAWVRAGDVGGPGVMDNVPVEDAAEQGNAVCAGDADAPAPGLVLAGGFYGVALGRAFFGESMFFTVPDASKAAFVWFVRLLATRGYAFVDCQQTTAHMQRFGAREISRMEFSARLARALRTPTETGRWRCGCGVPAGPGAKTA